MRWVGVLLEMTGGWYFEAAQIVEKRPGRRHKYKPLSKSEGKK